MTYAETPGLPADVLHLDGPTEVDVNGLPVLQVSYQVRGLRLTIGWTMAPPHFFAKPDRLAISPDETITDFLLSERSTMSEAEQTMYGGIDTLAMRAIPMAHALSVLRAPYERRVVAYIQEQLSPLPSRVESDEDYVHVAAAYVDLVNGPSVEPIRRLAEWTREKPGTWSGRLRRARAKGILEGTGRQATISPKYREVETQIRNKLLMNRLGER